jgi:flagellar hook assembly protein FlgD
VAARQLSPNGDGSRDGLRLRWTNQVALETLQLNVYRTDGTLVGSRNVPDRAAGAQAWSWNGEVGGARVPDGRYVLQLSGAADGRTYRAPSSRPVTAAQVAAYGVLVDTVPPALTATSASGSLISPNGDGVKDAVKLALSARGATHWMIQIARTGSAAARTVSGTGASGSYTWNGTTDAGAKVADGAWQATLSALDNAGNSARRTYPITVDTTPPSVSPAATPSRFSPDGDGATDRTRLSLTSRERVSGTARIWKGTTLVRSWALTSLSSWAATWDGRNAAGARVKDGRYTFMVAVRDAGGNRTTVSTPVVVDRTASYLRWSGSFFPQDGDALRPKAVLSWTLAREATTTLRLLDAGGTPVRTVWTGRVQAAGSRSWTWDGRLPGGGWAPQGRYIAELTATSSLGTTVLRRPVLAAGFAATLSAATVRPGQKLSVLFRTVEPLSTRPRVTFTQPGRSGVIVIATRLADGSYRAVFTVHSGGAGAGSVLISARDTGGHRNVTTLAIRIGS